MHEERPHYDAMMKIAEGNQDAAIFFCGMLAVTSSEHFLCRLLEAYALLDRNAERIAGEVAEERRRSQPPV